MKHEMNAKLILVIIGFIAVVGAMPGAGGDRFNGGVFDGYDVSRAIEPFYGSSRFNGSVYDGYDVLSLGTPFYGNNRFRGNYFDGYDNSHEGIVNIPYTGWSFDQSNVVIQIAGGHTNVIYSVLGFSSNLTNSAVVLYQTSNTTSFTFTDTNALASADRRFYRVTENTSGIVSTDVWIYTVFRKQLDTNTWSMFALGIDYGASNTLDSTLGFQLAQGLTSNNANTSADLFYIMDSQGNWAMCYPNASGVWREYNSGNATNTQVSSWQSFWVKRRNSGSVSCPIYSGYCFTNASPMTFRGNDWHMITWPLATDRRESDGSQQGWGFAAAGAQKGGSWMNSDLLTVGDGAALRFYYLHTSGRWCTVGQTTPASNLTFHIGEAYYYMHRGTGFTWTATAPQ